jgi:hypothetical protein
MFGRGSHDERRGSRTQAHGPGKDQRRSLWRGKPRQVLRDTRAGRSGRARVREGEKTQARCAIRRKAVGEAPACRIERRGRGRGARGPITGEARDEAAHGPLVPRQEGIGRTPVPVRGEVGKGAVGENAKRAGAAKCSGE